MLFSFLAIIFFLFYFLFGIVIHMFANIITQLLFSSNITTQQMTERKRCACDTYIAITRIFEMIIKTIATSSIFPKINTMGFNVSSVLRNTWIRTSPYSNVQRTLPHIRTMAVSFDEIQVQSHMILIDIKIFSYNMVLTFKSVSGHYFLDSQNIISTHCCYLDNGILKKNKLLVFILSLCSLVSGSYKIDKK